MSDQPSRPKRLWKGCLWKLGLLGVFALLLGMVLFQLFNAWFNLKSNAYLKAFAHSKEALYAITKGGIKTPLSFGSEEGRSFPEDTWRTVFRSEECQVQKLLLGRNARTFPQSAAWLFLPSELWVFSFSQDHFHFEIGFERGEEGQFSPQLAEDWLSEEGVAFAINGSFFSPQGQPLGLLVKNGRELCNKYAHWSGVFFVQHGRAVAGPWSLLKDQGIREVIPWGEQGVESLLQVYPSVMKDHTVFSYVEKEPDRFFDGSRLTYRSLVGMRQNGDIVFVVSGNGGVMRVQEVSYVAEQLGLQHATLMDGGRSLQYAWNLGSETGKFFAFNRTRSFSKKAWDKSCAPVFVLAKRKVE